MKGNITLAVLNNGKWYKLNIQDAVLSPQDDELEGPIPYGVNRAEVELDLVDQNGKPHYHKLVVMQEEETRHQTTPPHHPRNGNMFSTDQTMCYTSKEKSLMSIDG